MAFNGLQGQMQQKEPMTASPGAENLRCHPLWGTMATLYVLRLVITDYQLAPLIPATIAAPLLCKKNSI